MIEKVGYLELLAKMTVMDLLRACMVGVRGTSHSLAPAQAFGVILAIPPCSKEGCLFMHQAGQQLAVSCFPVVLEKKCVPATLSDADSILLQHCQCISGDAARSVCVSTKCHTITLQE